MPSKFQCETKNLNRNNNANNCIKISWKYFGDFIGIDVINSWYKQGLEYTYDKEDTKFGHFAQLVWVETKKAGFGKRTAADGTFYMVAHYSPSGCSADEWRENVLRPKNGATLLINKEEITKMINAKATDESNKGTAPPQKKVGQVSSGM